MGETAHIDSSTSFSTFCVDIDVKGFNDSLRKYLPVALEQILNFKPSDRILF
jgi:hypothetical protein